MHLHLANSYDVPPRVETPFEPGEDGISYTIDVCTLLVAVGVRHIRFETAEGCFRVGERMAQLEDRLPAWFVRLQSAQAHDLKPISVIGISA